MEMRNLITFLKIIETGSFTKAAKQLSYSQSAVTLQIQQLEEELQICLFDRIGKKVYLTEHGKELQQHVKLILDQFDQVLQIGKEDMELKGNLRLVSFDSLITKVLPTILMKYHERYPAVQITVMAAANIMEAELLLQQNDVDLAFISSSDLEAKQYEKISLKKSKFMFAAHPDHPLVQKKNITLEEISDKDIIIANQRYSFSELSNASNQILKDILNPAFDIWNPIAAMELARLGGGITLMPDYLLEDAINKKELTVLDVPELDFTIWLQVIYHNQKKINPLMRAFIELMQEYYS